LLIRYSRNIFIFSFNLIFYYILFVIIFIYFIILTVFSVSQWISSLNSILWFFQNALRNKFLYRGIICIFKIFLFRWIKYHIILIIFNIQCISSIFRHYVCYWVRYAIRHLVCFALWSIFLYFLMEYFIFIEINLLIFVIFLKIN